MRKIITHFKVVLTLLLPVTVSAQQIQWQSCMASQFNHWFGEEKPSPDLLCGYLSVPLKYTDTGGDASYEKKSQVKLKTSSSDEVIVFYACTIFAVV